MTKIESSAKYYTKSFIWGATAKLLDASVKFLTIPLLLSYFGKENYGILTLAIATNAYMALLDMGMNMGAVKFFSQWISSKDYILLHRTARTNLTFYLIIGVLNSCILVCLAIYGSNVFQLTSTEFATFQTLLFSLALFSVFNWVSLSLNQLLIADERIAQTHQIGVIKALLGLMLAVFTIYLKFSLLQYFIIFLLINASVILPYFYLCRKANLVWNLFPAAYWNEFSVIFKYSMAILAMGIFQFTASHSRPLVLGFFSDDGVGVLTEYRILEVFPLFIISIGGLLTGIFLPRSSKAIQERQSQTIEAIAYQGTKYTSVLVSLLCFPVMLNALDLLTLYVGPEYSHLSNWLVIWVLTITLFLHNTPVASLILATGKTRLLVLSSGVACVVSIYINASLTKKLGVGSAVVGYFVYIVIQSLFYYFYLNKQILGLNSFRIFKSFIVPTFIGFMIYLGIGLIDFHLTSTWLQVILKSLIWFIVFSFSLVLLRFIRLRDLSLMLFPHGKHSNV